MTQVRMWAVKRLDKSFAVGTLSYSRQTAKRIYEETGGFDSWANAYINGYRVVRVELKEVEDD